jgi:hypothetical protein
MEDDIDSNLDALHTATSGLKHLARAIGDEVHAGNKQLDRIIQDTDRVEDQIAVNRARLGRIRWEKPLDASGKWVGLDWGEASAHPSWAVLLGMPLFLSCSTWDGGFL